MSGHAETLDGFDEEDRKLIFELRFGEKKSPLPFKKITNPIWEEVDRAIDLIFENAGTIRLEILIPKSFYFKEIDFQSRGGSFRLLASTRDSNPKKGILEWWEKDFGKFRGTERFGDDNWDARTVCYDIEVAKFFFREFYFKGKFESGDHGEIISVWDVADRG